MSDLIDRQAAIDALSDGALVNYQAAGHNNGLVKAIDVIKGLPSAQPEKSTEKRTETNACDLISRQAVIDALEKSKKQYFDRRVIIGKMQDIVNNLPSAQPEIVRCNECFLHGVCRFEQWLGLDGYCSKAERRTDEQTD